MKKLFVILASAALVLTGCNNQFSFEDLEFDYPSDCTIDHHDTDGNTMAISISNPDGNSYIFIEVIKENPDAVADPDPEILSAYLIDNAYQIMDIFVLGSENISLSAPFSKDDMEVEGNDSDMEVYAFFDGTYQGGPYYGSLRATMFHNYRITAVAQGTKEEDVDRLIDKIYLTAHIK